jgi:integrase
VRQLWISIEQKHELTAAILKLQLLTGQRIGELMSMSWDDVDLQSGWWTIPAARAKNNRKHRVPLSTLAIELLTARRLNVKSSWVFPGPADESRHVLLPTIQRYIMQFRGQLNFSTHDLRRTVATELARAGVSRLVLKRVLNHRDMDITARYDHHSYDREAQSALEQWSRQVRAALIEEVVSANIVVFSR